MLRPFRLLATAMLSVVVAVPLACSGSNSGVAGLPNEAGTPPGQTGSSCATAAACYPGLDASALHGQETCLTQLTNGYCTHTCQTNADCCAVPGECASGLKEVCASFESSGKTYCFVSCSAADIAADPSAGTADASLFCQRWANATFTCRSTGGGKNNQQFCGP